MQVQTRSLLPESEVFRDGQSETRIHLSRQLIKRTKQGIGMMSTPGKARMNQDGIGLHKFHRQVAMLSLQFSMDTRLQSQQMLQLMR